MRRFAWVPFAVALASFVLPFATVSCESSRVEPTGADLVLRTAPEASGPDGARLGSVVLAAGGGLATAAFLAFALAGVGSLRAWNGGWIVLAGAAGVLALVVLKTRGGGAGDGLVEVDESAGAFMAGFAAGAGVLAALPAWLATRPSRPYAPAAGLVLIVAGYLLPAERMAVLDASYADSLDVREPWRGLFWLLPVAAGVVVVARRRSLAGDLASVTLAVLAPCALITLHEVWLIARDDRTELGAGPLLLLLGMALCGTWAALAARTTPAARPAPALRAPARARSPGSPPGPSARGSGGSPPAAP